MCAGLHRQAPGRGRQLPEFEALRDSARDIKNHTLAHLDLYLEAYERRWRRRARAFARTAESARIILGICREAGASTVTKGKSMIPRRSASTPSEAPGCPVETDLGEYIIQLRNELPSHIIAPPSTSTRTQVSRTSPASTKNSTRTGPL
jgi:L-lactate dehydrogenase complex protein LldF